MSHFTEGVLQAYLDDEVAADARAQVTAHVTDCADCAARLQELRELNASFAGAIGALDLRTLSSVSLADLRKRAEEETRRERWAGSRRTLSRAAILILGVTVATVPGSPVRAWLADAWEALTTDEPPAPVVQEAAPVPEVTLPPSGVVVQPLAGKVQVLLVSPAAGTVVRVEMIESPNAVLQASGGSASARFRTSTGQIIMTGGEQGEIRISIPRAADATIEVAGRTYVVKEGETLRYVGTGEAQRDGNRVTFQTPK